MSSENRHLCRKAQGSVDPVAALAPSLAGKSPEHIAALMRAHVQVLEARPAPAFLPPRLR